MSVSTSKYDLRCEMCGKFIGIMAMQTGKAKYKFIPDSICGPEESYWICEKCNEK